MPYATCLYHFRWRKKKAKSFIIPASNFITIESKEESNSSVSEIKQVTSEEFKNDSEINHKENHSNSEENKEVYIPKINIAKEKKTSGLSLKSIKKKKEFQIKQMDVVLEEDDLPENDFKEEKLIEEWNNFVKTIEKKGLYNYASILRMDTPRLRDKNIILLELPNKTNKVELDRAKNDLLVHLRKKLNNYAIKLEITVNEELQKRFVYTPREKFEKMNEKNPNISLLKKTFDLDL